MLLLHQTGSVKVGEVVRYTLTYTPGQDRILPPPAQLSVRIKNTAAIPLRAAYLHGPYTLYVACYPATFDPYQRHDRAKEEGVPEFEPQLKAGGQWNASLTVPEEIRKDVQHGDRRRSAVPKGGAQNFTWIIEVASQVIFSKSASVSYEILVGRDERSVDLGFHGVIGSGQGAPGRLEDYQQDRTRRHVPPRGLFSKAVDLVVDDTESLWNTPPFPPADDERAAPADARRDTEAPAPPGDPPRRQKKIHLVLLTHGLHSNLGADMLYMKESIDTAAKKGREDARQRRSQRQAQRLAANDPPGLEPKSKSLPAVHLASSDAPGDDDSDSDEEVIVRGFKGNAVKTERGIQYLGKRFAKYILTMTYPDQPYLPVKGSSIGKSLSRSLPGSKNAPAEGVQPTHKNSSITKDEKHLDHDKPYKITSISFISHSLGGLIQTYAIAYIQKHSPEFFDLIRPVNFVAFASPFLGLSNENPIYVKFALDFGLVGRTGQDLGLTWRPPTLAKSGWGAVIGGLSTDAQKAERTPDPGAKPLLRILPTGPAHSALKKFRNRTVYSNVVNDGIVPLRTSCLLFLDWRGLGRVDKARRENGLVGTMVGWGWAEMTGQNVSSPRKGLPWNDLFGDSGDEAASPGKLTADPESKVPQPDASQGFDYDEPAPSQFLDSPSSVPGQTIPSEASSPSTPGLWMGFLNFFKPQAGHNKADPKSPRKTQKIYRRGQTMHHRDQYSRQSSREPSQEPHDRRGPDDRGDEADADMRKAPVRGSSLYTGNSENGDLEAPPRTTFLEAAGDVLSPPLPTRSFLLDPAARPRTIWHDRVYHPDDIPPPPPKRHRTFLRRNTGQDESQSLNVSLDGRRPSSSQSSSSSHPAPGNMKIEEKIARAYHKDLSWRKVLVRLEPDAHNNMIVRRMFANAYGWPVVKHMCDTHFAYTAAAQTRDEEEPAVERAKSSHEAVAATGEEVKGQTDVPSDEVEDERRGDGHAPPSPQSKSMDNIVITSASPPSVKEVSEDRHKRRAAWEGNLPSPVSARNRSMRTVSEAREARDDVSELVSLVNATGETSGTGGTSYGGMNSSKAVLSRLARQDSATWSDRFFDGSDDGDEDDEWDDGLNVRLPPAASGPATNDEDGYRPLDGPNVASALTSSPQSTKINRPREHPTDVPDDDNGHMITQPDAPWTAEPAELEPASRSSGVTTPRSQRGMRYDLQPGSMTSMSTSAGLGLALGENVADRRTRETGAGSISGPHGSKEASTRRGSLGVAEQVALARVKSHEEGEDGDAPLA